MAQNLPETGRAAVEQVQYLRYALQLQPACVVSYDRLAFDGGEYEPGLRVTQGATNVFRVADILLVMGYAVQIFLPQITRIFTQIFLFSVLICAICGYFQTVINQLRKSY